jgi:hypothetical protein
MYYGYLALLPEEELRTQYNLYPDDAVHIWKEVLQLSTDDLDRAYYRIKAAEWFISNRFGIGSFLWVCCYLDYDPQAIRANLSHKVYFLLN